MVVVVGGVIKYLFCVLGHHLQALVWPKEEEKGERKMDDKRRCTGFGLLWLLHGYQLAKLLLHGYYRYINTARIDQVCPNWMLLKKRFGKKGTRT